jgi:hypothetical protein
MALQGENPLSGEIVFSRITVLTPFFFKIQNRKIQRYDPRLDRSVNPQSKNSRHDQYMGHRGNG